MKTIKLLVAMLSLFMMTGIAGCESDDEENKKIIENPLTFDGVEILYDVLPSDFYTKVCCTSENTAYAISSFGKIFKTEDGGYSWTEQDSGTELRLTDMFFFDDLRGYIVGGGSYYEGIVLKTTDGGNTWESTNILSESYHIYFINKEIGFVTGNKLLKTQDGGETWNEVDLGYVKYGGINFFDEKTGFLIAEGDLLKTIDGGNNWTRLKNIRLNLGIPNKIQILNEIAYLSSITTKEIYKITGKGDTWQIINNPTIGLIHFINELQAIVGGQHWYELGYFPDGLLCITNDGGKSWEEELFSPCDFYKINDIDFWNDSTAIAVGQSPQGCILRLNF